MPLKGIRTAHNHFRGSCVTSHGHDRSLAGCVNELVSRHPTPVLKSTGRGPQSLGLGDTDDIVTPPVSTPTIFTVYIILENSSSTPVDTLVEDSLSAPFLVFFPVKPRAHYMRLGRGKPRAHCMRETADTLHAVREIRFGKGESRQIQSDSSLGMVAVVRVIGAFNGMRKREQDPKTVDGRRSSRNLNLHSRQREERYWWKEVV